MKFFAVFILLSIFAYSQVVADGKQKQNDIVPVKIVLDLAVDVKAITIGVVKAFIENPVFLKVAADLEQALSRLGEL